MVKQKNNFFIKIINFIKKTANISFDFFYKMENFLKKTINFCNIFIINNKENIKFIFGIGFLFLSLILFLSFFSYFFTWEADQSKIENIFDENVIPENWIGKIGAYLSNFFIYENFGISSFFIVFLFIVLGLYFFDLRLKLFPLKKTFFNTLILILLTSITFAYFLYDDDGNYQIFYGVFGYFSNKTLNSFIGKTGTFLFLILSFSTIFFLRMKKFLAFIKKRFFIIFNKKNLKSFYYFLEKNFLLLKGNIIPDGKNKPRVILKSNLKKINFPKEEKKINNFSKETKELKSKNEEITLDEDNKIEEIDEENLKINNENLKNYIFPDIELLKKYEDSNIETSHEELEKNKEKIKNTLENYKIEIIEIKAKNGPNVILYEIIPAPGIRISKIKNLEDDIALSLSALGIRIIAPQPGKGSIGIEVPSINPQMVSLHSVISDKNFQSSNFELPIALGKTISNETYIFDLTKMPHLLVAGATGQGKSVGLNVIITSLLYKKHPSELKFVLIDPKKVELSLYEKIEKNFLAKLPDEEEAIITDNSQVINTLASLNLEMDNRYKLLKQSKVRNIKEYNEKFAGKKSLAYIVLIIDEFADLIMTAGKDIETPIARLAQLARAIGIHLIVATQRPSANIITGIIKANFPARMAFKVASMVDSRTILDASGANQLIGRGDMLITENNNLIRLQCAYVDLPELEKITNFIGNQNLDIEIFNLPEIKKHI